MRGSLWRRLAPPLLAAFLVAVAHLPSASAAGIGDMVSEASVDAGNAVRAIEPLLSPVSSITGQLPVNPQQALIDRTAELSGELGFPQDPTVQILLARLPDEIAGRLANVVGDALACHRITTAHFAEIRPRLEEVARDGGGLDPAGFQDIRTCAESLWASTAELELGLQPFLGPNRDLANCTPVGPVSIDLWPVLRVEGTCSNTVYANDYLVSVEIGGNDTYRNNIGSNMVDVNFSPVGSTAIGLRGMGPARGCQQAVGGLAAGDCIPTVSVLLDLDGQDTYGVRESPDVDAPCTSDLVVRRMVVGGVGFLGVGILRDADPQGNDTYTGKTVSLGSGHVFGVGILSDAGGNDKYLAIRNSEGFALVGGAGILRDEGGNDSYDFYMPTGGVIDDQDLCDVDLRFVQGGGNVLGPTVGILIEDSGNDTYRGGFSVDFDAPAEQVTTGRAGSQGFGNNGGFGVLVDLDGSDGYSIVGDQGVPVRRDHMVLPPNPNCQTSTCSGGVFIDR